MGAEPGQAQARQLQRGGDQLHRFLGRHAEALEPDVDLHEHVAGVSCRLRVGPGPFQIHHRRREPVGEGLGRGLGQGVGIHEDGRGDAVPAEANPLGEVRHAQRVGAAGQEGLGHLGGPVAVAVGLDHRVDLSLGPDHLAHHADVRGGGGQIDLEGGRTGWEHGRTMNPGRAFLKAAFSRGFVVLTSPT